MSRIFVNTSGAQRDMRRISALFSGQNIDKATSRAINHVLGTARTRLSKEIRSVYNILASDAKDATELKKSSESSLTGYIYASANPLSLSKFNPTSIEFGKGKILVQTKRVGGKKGSFASSAVTRIGSNTGVVIEILKGKKETLPSAFLLLQSSGNAAVMARGEYNNKGFDWGKSRLPIHKLNTKSVYWASQNDKVAEVVGTTTLVDYEKRLIHEIDRATTGQGLH